MNRTRIAAGAIALALAANAQAEGRIRIAEQYGVVYLLLNIAQEQKLIEKYGKQAGVDIKVEWTQLSGGAAINDALLSGAIDIGSAGVGPLITLWDRTKGRHNVRGIAALGSFPYYLVTNNPKVKTIADFTDKDRIGLPAVGVSVQARILQMAVAKQWGDAHFARLDKITQTLPHPDATNAIIAGGTEITGHFATPPFQEQELAQNPNARVVLKSYDVQGGPSSSTLLYATEKYRSENPKTYRAFVQALAEAADFATKNPEGAADVYLKVNKSKVDRALLLKIFKNPEVQFRIAPQNTLGLAQFMHKVGAVKTRAASWRDYFFDDALVKEGS
ncbi:ABC transporter substrate-binding protein [Massilia sp. YMA4]|uniref:ABC transporter substrate-binding protein n=1 Tax=Massilia sp. YMA4 TaxID=1593482 RepID=UPI000DD10C15|nr:ABC transporter substrate-binding protein [Massilia sp. YMA4]AXA92838.1 ABC transporter substrate-binding protein [Massilia sp. YMA4]